MKKLTFTGTLTYYKRLNCSIYGNPAFYGEFENEHGDVQLVTPNAHTVF